jgi:hypothetical protein
VAGELLLRALGSFALDDVARRLTWFGPGTKSSYVVDEEMGFRPILGTTHYSRWGTIHNGYRFAKQPGVQRVLFLGDSVTARGKIIVALRGRYPSGFEFWNAGVESFNTRQEVEFYRRYNAPLDPDHVVLTFHLNDFETTPVAFLDEHGELAIYAPDLPIRRASRALYENLHLARMFVQLTTNASAAKEEAADAIRTALLDLQGLLGEERRFTVLVFPILEPPETWRKTDTWAHARILAILGELGIRHFDLLPVLRSALADGVDVQETPGDPWHPSAAYGRRIAAHLFREGLLR